MIEYVFISGNVESLWEIDYEKNFALDVTELNIIKNNVTKYSGTIEDYLKEKGLKKCTSTIVERFPHVHTMEANVVVHLDNCDCSF